MAQKLSLAASRLSFKWKGAPNPLPGVGDGALFLHLDFQAYQFWHECSTSSEQHLKSGSGCFYHFLPRHAQSLGWNNPLEDLGSTWKEPVLRMLSVAMGFGDGWYLSLCFFGLHCSLPFVPFQFSFHASLYVNIFKFPAPVLTPVHCPPPHAPRAPLLLVLWREMRLLFDWSPRRVWEWLGTQCQPPGMSQTVEAQIIFA